MGKVIAWMFPGIAERDKLRLEILRLRYEASLAQEALRQSLESEARKADSAGYTLIE